MITLAILGIISPVLAWPVDHWYAPCSSDLYTNTAYLAYCLEYSLEAGSLYSECMMNDEDYLRTQFTCIEQFRNYTNEAFGHDYGFGTTEESWSYMQAVYNHKKPKYTAREMIDVIARNPVTQTWVEANATGKGAFLHSDLLLNKPVVDGQIDTIWHMTWENRLGGFTVAYVALVLVVQTSFNFLSWVIPSGARVFANNEVARYLRKYIAIPALFTKHRAQPVRLFRYIQLCYPNRMHSLLIFGYVGVCIICLAVHYPVQISPYTYTSPSTYKAGWLGWRSGCLALYKMPLLWLFAGRNNFLIWVTGWQFEIFNIWHRWIARMFFVDVFIHSVAYTVEYAIEDYYTLELEEGWFRWGIAGTVLIGLLCFHATKTLRAPAYELFKYLHIAMAVVTLVATWYHCKDFFYLEENYTTWAIWGFDRAARLLRILINGLNNKAHIKSYPNGFLEINVDYNGALQPSGGSYYFLHFGDPLYFYQSHPLSVVPTGDNKTLKFVSKIQKGMTKKLFMRSEKSGGEVTQRIWLDGPYGASFSIESFREVSLYAGGVGFTAVYGHLIHFLKTHGDLVFHLHWCISTDQVLELFDEEITTLHNHPRVDVTIHLDDKGIGSALSSAGTPPEKKPKSASLDSLSSLNIEKVHFIPDFAKLVHDEITSSTGPIVFFCCGPGPMSDAIRTACAKNLLKTKNYVQYYEESFTM